MFNWLRRKPATTGQGSLSLSFTQGGLEFRAKNVTAPEASAWLREPGWFAKWEPVALLGQLETEGYAVTFDDALLIGWEDFFSIGAQPDYAGCDILLNLPRAAPFRVELITHGSLADQDFQLALNWLDERGRPLDGTVRRVGAILEYRNQDYLLSEAQWRLAAAVAEFAQRPDEERSQTAQERYWGKLRRLAKAVGVKLDRYLERTVVVTAERLDLGLRTAQVEDTQVVELIPGIPAVPSEAWLAAFDGYVEVQDHYDLITPRGERLRVLLEHDAKTVLKEIKRMPRRRIAGARAEAFLRNPYALLGEAMAKVVPPEHFELTRQEAGVHLYDFRATALRENDGHIEAIRIDMDARDEAAPGLPPIKLQDRSLVRQFTDVLAVALGEGAACFRWGRHALEIRGGADEQLDQLRAWLCDPWSGEPLVRYAEVFDLSGYAPRVAGIGVHQPQYVPYLARKNVSGGWIPENLEPVVEFRPKGGEPILVPVSEPAREAVRDWLAGHPEPGEQFMPPGWPAALAPAEARQLLDTFQIGLAELPKREAKPEPETQAEESPPRERRKTLSIRQNVEQVDYLEERARELAFAPETTPEMPAWLRPGIQLKAHQMTGLAWLQHLWCRQDRGVRGALLADDMGLGKTLQLLALIAWHLERNPAAEPALIVAPVSLLDNWQAEVTKFFEPRLEAMVLPLYGKALSERKVRRGALDDQLRDQRLQGFLKPDWLGSAKLVLTTYETLRDLEFSFAKQRWSVMVCDEAQKIKTPGALMTHAAKAQNAGFKIACTGTPVENSLADLWCLFDFIQPGLLGSLSEFCRTYRRPIEAKTDEQRDRLQELRRIIEPQVLRRLKTEVADLPEKKADPNCRRLRLSGFQRQLYQAATAGFQAKAEQNGTLILGLLHRLRSICADPREEDMDIPLALSLAQHRQRSPKLDWLMGELERIRDHQEKAILFTEFRDLQRLLQYRIHEQFGFSPIIVNGGTKAGREGGDRSRQALIDAFQAKPDFGVIILSTTAVGFGVNIQAANHVIHFTRAWNPAKEDQATDRAYRIGQTKPVYVYYPTVTAEDFQTFEARLDDLLEAKRELASDMLNGTGELDFSDWLTDQGIS